MAVEKVRVFPLITGGPMFPPVAGGLHCGTVETWLEAYDQPVFAPIYGGLHCGTVEAWLDAYDQLVLPPITGGLHCGAFRVYPGGDE